MDKSDSFNALKKQFGDGRGFKSTIDTPPTRLGSTDSADSGQRFELQPGYEYSFTGSFVYLGSDTIQLL